MRVLEKRVTHGYVGTYKYLDKWEFVGEFEEIGAKDLPTDGTDHTEPLSQLVYVLVKSDKPDSEIRQALHDHYTSWGCAHEYDCCGCRSYQAGDEKRVTGDLWQVTVNSFRNF